MFEQTSLINTKYFLQNIFVHLTDVWQNLCLIEHARIWVILTPALIDLSLIISFLLSVISFTFASTWQESLFLGVLSLQPADTWNSVKPLVLMCINVYKIQYSKCS